MAGSSALRLAGLSSVSVATWFWISKRMVWKVVVMQVSPSVVISRSQRRPEITATRQRAAAIHRNHGTGHELGMARRQEQRHVGDLVRGAEAAQRHRGHKLLHRLGRRCQAAHAL